MAKQENISVPMIGLGEIGLENYAPYLMNRIMGRYNASLQQEMATLGLTTPQMRALAILAVVDGILLGELAVYAVVQQSTLSRAVETLTHEGWIWRQTDPGDSRATRVFLTEAGRKIYNRLWPHMAGSYQAMFEGITDEEQQAFTHTLQIMLRNIRKHNF